jgi:hypothetical protein
MSAYATKDGELFLFGRGTMRFLIAIAILVGLVSTASAQSIPAPSKWMNQRTSILEIQSVDGNGVITGKFTNNAPNTLCMGTTYDIVGHTLQNGRVFFGVTFPAPCHTITSWRGTVSGTTYTTTFALSFINDENGAIETVSGTDTFTQQ